MTRPRGLAVIRRQERHTRDFLVHFGHRQDVNFEALLAARSFRGSRGVGVKADEQSRARLIPAAHARADGHKKIALATQHDLQILFARQILLHTFGDSQGQMLFENVRLLGGRTTIGSAMSRIDGHREDRRRRARRKEQRER